MGLFVAVVSFHELTVFLVLLASMLTPAPGAPCTQPVSVVGFFSELAFTFPLFAFGAAFLFHAINGPMAILIFEVSFHMFKVSPLEFSSMVADALSAP